MTDYISRQAAIDYLDENELPWREWVNDIPAADVRENVKGNWIRFKDIAECNNCKAVWHDNLGLTKSWSFCPKCGADMRTD